jgi:hypothetical protein
VHFIAEVAAVLARIKPTEAQSDLLDLIAIARRTVDSPEVYATAVTLATQLNHPLFDTLYHALALETPGAMFVTADRCLFMRLWGIATETRTFVAHDLSGKGAAISPGRWNGPGQAVVYALGHRAGGVGCTH